MKPSAPLSQAAAVLHNETGKSPVLLVCEHASNHIPDRYNGLGLDETTRESHAAWDPGALAVSLLLAEILDARLVASTVSRLVYDCNRPPDAASAMPTKSEVFNILANQNLSPAARQERIDTVYAPFTTLLTDTIKTAPTPPVIVTMHSFTPTYMGDFRAVELGVLHDTDSRLADAMLAHAPVMTPLNTQRNEPYGMDDGVTHTLKLHTIDNGLLNVMIEIRNDLIQTDAQQRDVAQSLGAMLTAALTDLTTATQSKKVT